MTLGELFTTSGRKKEEGEKQEVEAEAEVDGKEKELQQKKKKNLIKTAVRKRVGGGFLISYVNNK